eukprot:scpid68257/ scgid21328/ 
MALDATHSHTAATTSSFSRRYHDAVSIAWEGDIRIAPTPGGSAYLAILSAISLLCEVPTADTDHMDKYLDSHTGSGRVLSLRMSTVLSGAEERIAEERPG